MAPLPALVAVADPIKPTSAEAVAALRAEGIRLVMLTGDNERTANAVAAKLGIAEVVADASPQRKLERVRELKAEGRVVAMAGDGINDAPALAAADVGIAMGTGTDVAMATAAVTLVKGDLQRDRSRAPVVARDAREHPPESVLRVRLQRRRRAGGGRRSVSAMGSLAVADACGRRDERVVDLGDRQRAQVAQQTDLSGALYAVARSAAMRVSSGGCDANSADKP